MINHAFYIHSWNPVITSIRRFKKNTFVQLYRLWLYSENEWKAYKIWFILFLKNPTVITRKLRKRKTTLRLNLWLWIVQWMEKSSRSTFEFPSRVNIQKAFEKFFYLLQTHACHHKEYPFINNIFILNPHLEFCAQSLLFICCIECLC